MIKIINLAYLLIILIFADLCATLFWIYGGIAVEANPIMKHYFDNSGLSFTLAKLGLSFTGIYALYYFRKDFKKTIFRSFLILNAIYLAVFLYHLHGLLFIVL